MLIFAVLNNRFFLHFVKRRNKVNLLHACFVLANGSIYIKQFILTTHLTVNKLILKVVFFETGYFSTRIELVKRYFHIHHTIEI